MTQFVNNPQTSLPELQSNSRAIQYGGDVFSLLDSPRIRCTNSGNDVLGFCLGEGSVG